MPPPQPARFAYQQGSLWNTTPSGLLGDRRAHSLGDILTVVIEIDEEAEMRNSTSRTREGSEEASIDAFFGAGERAAAGGDEVPSARRDGVGVGPSTATAR